VYDQLSDPTENLADTEKTLEEGTYYIQMKSCGHLAGDELLISAATIIKDCFGQELLK